MATGSLTNVALLLAVYPEVKDVLKEIVIMGGAIGSGNTSPSAEFNIQVCKCPPHAWFPVVCLVGVRVRLPLARICALAPSRAID